MSLNIANTGRVPFANPRMVHGEPKAIAWFDAKTDIYYVRVHVLDGKGKYGFLVGMTAEMMAHSAIGEAMEYPRYTMTGDRDGWILPLGEPDDSA